MPTARRIPSGARLRAAAGHPAPFNLKYMEIGNENGGPDYVERWPLLVNAIRAKYPDIQFIVTDGFARTALSEGAAAGHRG